MNKFELESGMVVELRNENKYLVVGYTLIGEDGCMGLTSYDREMYNEVAEGYNIDELDIMKVYKPDERYKLIPSRFDALNSEDLIWERQKPIHKFSDFAEPFVPPTEGYDEDTFRDHLENYCIVEMRDGSINVYLESFQTDIGEFSDVFMDVDSSLYISLDYYDEGLSHDDECEFDIATIYRPFDITSELFMFIEDRDCVDLVVKCYKHGDNFEDEVLSAMRQEREDSEMGFKTLGGMFSGTIENATFGEGLEDYIESLVPTIKDMLEQGMKVTLANGSVHTVELDSSGDMVLIDVENYGSLILENYDDNLVRDPAMFTRFDEGLNVVKITKQLVSCENMTFDKRVWERA